MHWLDFLFPPRVDEIAVRDISADAFLALVTPRLVPETRPETVALLPFADTRVRAAIHEAKYHGNEYAFGLLGSVLVEYLRDADDIRVTRSNLKSESSRLNLVTLVPVPLGAARRKERGFNQVEEIARCALRGLGEAGASNFILETGLLIRARETTSQVSLPRDMREENMRGAFRVVQDAARSIDPSRTYILVDDVITTGATLGAAVDALQEAGVRHIVPLALAH